VPPSRSDQEVFWEKFWRFVGFAILLAAALWCAREADRAARSGRFEFNHFWKDSKGGRSHAFEGIEARRVAAGLYGVAILCGVWGFRLAALPPWFLGRFRKAYLRLSLAAIAACVVILFPPWQILSSWPVLALYFLPVTGMIVIAATHRVAEHRRQDVRGKSLAICFMAAVLLCAIGEGDSFVTGILGFVTCLILLAHVEKLTARPSP
jgi:hypothetical protein